MPQNGVRCSRYRRNNKELTLEADMRTPPMTIHFNTPPVRAGVYAKRTKPAGLRPCRRAGCCNSLPA